MVDLFDRAIRHAAETGPFPHIVIILVPRNGTPTFIEYDKDGNDFAIGPERATKLMREGISFSVTTIDPDARTSYYGSPDITLKPIPRESQDPLCSHNPAPKPPPYET